MQRGQRHTWAGAFFLPEEPDTSAASLRRSSSAKGYDVIVCDNLSHGRKKSRAGSCEAHSCRTPRTRAALDSNFSEHRIDA